MSIFDDEIFKSPDDEDEKIATALIALAGMSTKFYNALIASGLEQAAAVELTKSFQQQLIATSLGKPLR